ncbi:MAG TPA: ABC transporter permease [Pseudonocardia sp.]|jgi:phospholipid/cholesterol/gamma-HCH transport system permease protein|uniref:ABC transporter permease n=1 Tax=Pseudonocardia sp. TaxID=60912 RepID=UPI002C7D6667|nr:ABC transporter permease [Pseudonocardia sp.]HTF52528.1 ABC transporter permease [Pseudonocardia sp.]
MTITEAGGAAEPAPAVQSVDAVRRGLSDKLTNMVEMIIFFGQAFAAIPRTRKYASEIFRQTGILILSSGLIIWFMELLIGAVFAVQGHYLTRQFGAGGYVGIFPALGGLRTCAPEMWGWILAAKVGCGLVAEIGSARISDEIDALEVMGVESKPYLIATRLIAALIAMPFLYIIGLGLLYLSSWFMVVHVLHTVSEGGFLTVLWAFQSPLDVLFSMIWTMVLGTIVVLVGCYYGYTASGGPVGVGQNTAKSMVVNMVLVSVIGLIAQQAFWGGFPNAPIAN